MRRRRTHGLQWPLSQEQVLTLAGYVVLAATFFAIAGSAMEVRAQRDASIVLNAVCTCFVFACWIYTELTDPSLEGGVPYPCMRRTQGQIRYCAACRKRVPGMDHHCVWLNTCIGKRNYVPFFVMTLVGSLQFSFLTVADAMVLFSWASTLDTGGAVLVVLHGVGAVVVAIAFLSLLGFHLYLIVLGVGTYDWIFLGSGGAAGGGAAPGKGAQSLPTPPSPQEMARREADARARWEAKYGKVVDEEKGEVEAAARPANNGDDAASPAPHSGGRGGNAVEGGEARPAPPLQPCLVPGVGALWVRNGALYTAAGGAERVLRLWPTRGGGEVTRVVAASSRGGLLALVVEARLPTRGEGTGHSAPALEGWVAAVDLPSPDAGASDPPPPAASTTRVCSGPVPAAALVWATRDTRRPCALVLPVVGEGQKPPAPAAGGGELLGSRLVVRALEGGAWREAAAPLKCAPETLAANGDDSPPPLLCADPAGTSAALVVPARGGGPLVDAASPTASVVTCASGGADAEVQWREHSALPLRAPEAACVVRGGGAAEDEEGGQRGRLWVVGAAGIPAGEDGAGSIAVACSAASVAHAGADQAVARIPAHTAAPQVLGVAAGVRAAAAGGRPRVGVLWREAEAGDGEERWAVVDLAEADGVSVCRVEAEGGRGSAVGADPAVAEETGSEPRLLWATPEGRVLAIPAVHGVHGSDDNKEQ